MDIVAMQKIKNINKMGKKSEKNRGWLITMLRVLSRVHFQIWKVWLCQKEKKKTNKK
jgi:hypothetical protein